MAPAGTALRLRNGEAAERDRADGSECKQVSFHVCSCLLFCCFYEALLRSLSKVMTGQEPRGLHFLVCRSDDNL
jgi:hypothetical protein